jgi:hypothetical protein
MPATSRKTGKPIIMTRIEKTTSKARFDRLYAAGR